MTVLSTAAFKFCAPPEEYFDYPLYFPKPNFPGRVASSVKDDEEFEQQMVRYIEMIQGTSITLSIHIKYWGS